MVSTSHGTTAVNNNPFYMDYVNGQPPSTSTHTPPHTPPKVTMDNTVREITTPSFDDRHNMKIRQTRLKDSQNSHYLPRYDSYSTLGGDSPIQKFESILQRLEMVLADLLQNTEA